MFRLIMPPLDFGFTRAIIADGSLGFLDVITKLLTRLEAISLLDASDLKESSTSIHYTSIV